MPRKGEHCSPETRRKMSAAQKQRYADPAERFLQSIRRSGFKVAVARHTMTTWWKDHEQVRKEMMEWD